MRAENIDVSSSRPPTILARNVCKLMHLDAPRAPQYSGVKESSVQSNLRMVWCDELASWNPWAASLVRTCAWIDDKDGLNRESGVTTKSLYGHLRSPSWIEAESSAKRMWAGSSGVITTSQSSQTNCRCRQRWSYPLMPLPITFSSESVIRIHLISLTVTHFFDVERFR